MKNIVLIAITGNNQVYGCPLQTGHQEFDMFFRNFIGDGDVAISGDMFNYMPSRVPPFPCRTAYILSDISQFIAENKLTDTKAVSTLEELFEATLESSHNLFIFLDQKLQEKILGEYGSCVEEIILGEVNEPFILAEDAKIGSFVELNPMTWWPIPRTIHAKESFGNRSPGFVVKKYEKQHAMM